MALVGVVNPADVTSAAKVLPAEILLFPTGRLQECVGSLRPPLIRPIACGNGRDNTNALDIAKGTFNQCHTYSDLQPDLANSPHEFDMVDRESPHEGWIDTFLVVNITYA